ncbi:prominin-like protein [Drosophila tropicalis]|uniref:prominin-like protein n=1 Tax=Drosophila tropicalis TaxID=46794 RepID=UPI0035AC1A01
MNSIGFWSICSYWALKFQYVLLADDVQFVQYERYVSRFNDPDLGSRSEGGDLDDYRGGILSHVYALANDFTGALVMDSKRIPKGYITPGGNDIDKKAVEDNWLAYLQQQRILMMIILFLIILMILIPLIGIFYCLFCAEGRRTPLSVLCTYLCWGLMMTIVVIFMLFFLIFALIASVKLHNNLNAVLTRSICGTGNSSDSPLLTAAEVVRSTSEHLYHLHVENYKQFQQRIEQILQNEPQTIQSFIQTKANDAAIERLSQIVDNLQNTQSLFARLKDEVPPARHLATQFRDALRDVKRNLLVTLIIQCPLNECKQFYRQHAISYLDMGCLHYDMLPDTDVFIISIQSLLNSKLVDYPRNASRHLKQMSSVFKNRMNKLINTIQEDVNDGGQQLLKKSNMTTELLERLVEELTAQPTNRQNVVRSPPVLNLRNKLGKFWFHITVAIIWILLLVPLLILFSLALYLQSSQASRNCLCCTLVTIFVLYFLAILLTLFFLVHGALLWHGFCSRKFIKSTPDLSPNKVLNPNQYLPVRFALTHRMPQMRAEEAFQRCHNTSNENLYKLWQLEDLYNLSGLHQEVIEDIRNCLHEMENSSLPVELGEIHSQAEAVIHQMLSQKNLSSYDSARYTRHLCRQLIPEPHPGPLPDFWRSLDNLASRVRGNSLLRNQIVSLQAFHQHLGKPLAKFVNHMLDVLQKIDNHLSTLRSDSDSDTGNFGKSMRLLLNEIRMGNEFVKRKANDVTTSMGRNIIKYVDDSLTGYIHMVRNVTENDLNSCSPLMRSETQKITEYSGLCNRIAKPMNAIWFGLFIFSMLLLPSLCCIHLMRCNLEQLYAHQFGGAATAASISLAPLLLSLSCQFAHGSGN